VKKLYALLALLCVACASPSGQSPTASTPPTAVAPTPAPYPTPWPEAERAKVYALLHIWYKAIPMPPSPCPPDERHGLWGLRWAWPPKADNPCGTIAGVPWLRQISSESYPLTGPYDSRNEDILRWQIRQAQAAGIDGFFVSTYSWQPHLLYLKDIFFGDTATGRKGILRIAQEEKFKVGIEAWGILDDPESRSFTWWWEDMVEEHLDLIAAHPARDAYLTINGKPAYWIILPDWYGDYELRDFFDGTESKPRNMSWIVRQKGTPTLNRVLKVNEGLRRSVVQYESRYDDPTTTGFRFNRNFGDDLTRIRENFMSKGMVPIAHAYTGYDERSGVVDPSYQGRWGERSVIPKFLDAAAQARADIILVESFNEHAEGSHIEASLNIGRFRDMGQERDLFLDENGQDAPYKYLDIIRRFNGMQEWVPPKPPPCSALDPLMREYNRAGPKETRCTE
jgi:hypothetical protein